MQKRWICSTCEFLTPRLLVKEWHSVAAHESTLQDLNSVVRAVLTPSATKSLPLTWQGAYTASRARDWIEARDNEGPTLLVVERSSGSPVGLMILFEQDREGKSVEIRLGYVLAESAWGSGLGSELVGGFVEWCRATGVESIVGGVERENTPSRRVLEKTGFLRNPTTAGKATELFELQLLPEQDTPT